MFATLNGWKTYIVCAVTVLYAGAQYWAGHIDLNAATAMVLAAAGGAGLRSGVATTLAKLLAAAGVNLPPSASAGQIKAAVNGVRRVAPLMLAGALVLGFGLPLTGCASLGIGGGLSLSVAQPTADALTVIKGGQDEYIANCITASVHATWCNEAEAKAASAKTTLAASTIVHAIETASGDSPALSALLTDLVGDVVLFQTQQNAAKARAGTKGDALAIITIAEQVIPIALQIYQQIQSLNASGVTAAQLDALVTEIAANNATIQAQA